MINQSTNKKAKHVIKQYKWPAEARGKKWMSDEEENTLSMSSAAKHVIDAKGGKYVTDTKCGKTRDWWLEQENINGCLAGENGGSGSGVI